MKTKKRLRTALGTLLHAFVLLLLTLYWLSLPNTYSDEAFFIKWTSLIKKNVLRIDQKPAPNEVLFVDVSDIKTTIPKLNEFEEISDYNRDVIVNRAHLAEFLDLIRPYRSEVKQVFLHLTLEEESPDDSLFLASALALQDKLLISTRLNQESEFIPAVFPLDHAQVSYYSTNDLFLKYNLFLADSLKTAPVRLLEKIDGAQVSRGFIFDRIDGRRALSAPIVDFKVRPIDFKDLHDRNEQAFTVYNMGTLLELSMIMEAEELAAFFRNRLIFIGDFKNNLRQTVFGKTAGSIIIYNAYLTLRDGSWHISFAWIMFLLLSFWFLSYIAFTARERRWWLPAFLQPRKKWLEETVNEIFILVTITVLSYFIFNIHIKILGLIVWLQVVTYLWQKSPIFYTRLRAFFKKNK